MTNKINTIREELEKQAQLHHLKTLEYNQQKRIKIDKKDSLRLGWQDVVIF